MRRPTVVRVERKIVRMVRRSGVTSCRRDYVTLRFGRGGPEGKLAVSGKVARWLRG